MFNPCRHIRSTNILAAKASTKETMLLSGNILTKLYPKCRCVEHRGDKVYK